jgi:uncharacterized protein with ParB-like and HNH nuclease domain
MASNNIDLGDETLPVPETPLEEKYREQMRQIVSQKIELPISTLPAMIKEQINLNPEFQRRNRWDDERRSRFIESIIMNVPIPPVFLGEDEYGKYVVLDGRQRLTAVNEFLKNTYRLKKLDVWNELNGANFDELQKRKVAAIITRRFIPAIVVLKESSSIVKYDVFDRLNTGGLIANPMEIRNAIYQGAFTKRLQEFSKDQTFRRLWDIPLDDIEAEKNTYYSQMFDVELVLRFFAVLEPDRINLAFKDYMSDFLESRNKTYKENPEVERHDIEVFSTAVKNVWRTFGESSFRRPDENGDLTLNKSVPLADAEMAALWDVREDRIDNALASRIRDGFAELCARNDVFRKAITSGTNGKGAISSRVGLARDLIRNIV